MACYSQSIIPLVIGDCVAGAGAGVTIDRAAIISLVGKAGLNIAYDRASVRITRVRITSVVISQNRSFVTFNADCISFILINIMWMIVSVE